MTDAVELNWDVALAAVGNDRELLREVVDVLALELPRLRRSVADAVVAKDHDALRRAAHSLKGSLRFLGDIPAHQLAQSLEEIAVAEATSKVPATWNGLQAALDGLAVMLEDFLARTSSKTRSVSWD